MAATSPHDRLAELGLSLPGPYPPHDPLVAVVEHGGVARTSGQLPRDHDGVLREPLLYPSLFFKKHRALYYELLNGVRVHGDWERWLDYFVEGIQSSAAQAVITAQRLLALVNADRARVATLGRGAGSALAVHQSLQRQPVTTAAALEKDTGLALATVNRVLVQLGGLGIVEEITRRQRNRIFSYRGYVDVLNTEL